MSTDIQVIEVETVPTYDGYVLMPHSWLVKNRGFPLEARKPISLCRVIDQGDKASRLPRMLFELPIQSHRRDIWKIRVIEHRVTTIYQLLSLYSKFTQTYDVYNRFQHLENKDS